jgi:hypothetical protein
VRGALASVTMAAATASKLDTGPPSAPWTRPWLESRVRSVVPKSRVTVDYSTKPGTCVILARVGNITHRNGAWWARKQVELRIRDKLREDAATQPPGITYRIEVRR